MVDGRLESSFYAWETEIQDTTNNHLRGYQALALDGTQRLTNGRVFFKTYLRVTNDFRSDIKGDPNTRIFNTYVGWTDRTLDVRLGRQFLYAGVGSGTLDGLRVGFSKKGLIQAVGYIGTQAPFTRNADIQGWSYSFWGAQLSTDYLRKTRFSLSIAQKSRDNKVEFQQIGLDGSLNVSSMVYLFGRLDYDISYNSRPQKIILRGDLRPIDKLYLYTEFGYRRPRIPESSMFSSFRIEPSNQFRVGTNYRLHPKFGVNGGYDFTTVDGKSSGNLNLSVSSPWGTFGYAHRLGYGGKGNGLFGNLLYSVNEKLSMGINLGFDRYQFSEDYGETKDATYSGAMVILSPIRDLRIEAQIQNARNPLYKQDIRGFGRLIYSFRYKK